MKIAGSKIIVTGAGQGMGAHFTRRLAELGAHVAAGDIKVEELEKVRSEATGVTGSIHTRRLDVADEKDCEAFVAWATEAMGGLDGLVNNAGIIRDGLLVKRDKTTGAIVKMSSEQWNAVIRVNLAGATWMVREVAAKLLELGHGGAIVNMSSVSRHGNRGQTNYVAAKAGLAADTVCWSREFAPYGIRVNALAPGAVETPMVASMNPKAREALVERVLVGRIGQPEDLFLGVKFALECEYLNGQTIDIDGGR